MAKATIAIGGNKVSLQVTFLCVLILYFLHTQLGVTLDKNLVIYKGFVLFNDTQL